jgi:flagellar basal-body rod modification protein FlgD
MQVTASSGGTAVVQVKNASGQVVATYQRQVTAGWNDVSWDGKLADGSAAADGDYTVAVSVTDRAGNAVTSTTYESGPVESLRFENNVAIVRILGQDHYVAEIAQINR